MRGSRKIRTPERELVRTCRTIGLPEAQSRADFRIVEVANHTEADQRHSIRSKQTKTARRKTRIEKLQSAGVLTRDEAAACEWYAQAYELGYSTLAITANYEGGRGGGGSQMGHLARYKAQEEARLDYAFAREAIPRFLLPLFERVVLEGQSMTEAGGDAWEKLAKAQRSAKLSAAFRLAANLLHGRIAHLLAVE